MPTKDYIKIGVDKGYIKLINEEKTIHYIRPDKKYKYTDPEEVVRAQYYVELIEKYQYPENRINLEVVVPRRTPSDLADIVVYKDDEKKEPYIIIECKKDGVSEGEFNQAIEQIFGNSNSLSGVYAAVVAGTTRRTFDVKGFKPQERQNNIIADIPVRYGKVQEWRYKKGDRDWDLIVVDKQELIRTLEKCHDTLWQGGKLSPTVAFDELCKIIFVKIRDEKKPREKGEPYDFQIKTHETPDTVYTRINNIYDEAKQQDPEVFTDSIKVSKRRLFTVINHLQGVNLNKTDLDVKGVAFERFMEDFFKGKNGQYFTPREVVEFMVNMVQPDHESFVVDPACGSGGFLLHCLDFVRFNASKYYDEGTIEHHKYWHEFAEKRLFGIEINDSIARVAKMNMIIHDDGHTNVIGNDALENISNIYKKNRGFQKEKFDIILTNPPFGATVKKEEVSYLGNYTLGEGKSSQKTEILFIEQCFNLLKWGTGKLAIILPDGILTNSSVQYVRDFIEQRFQILAIISLPQTTFTHYGAGVKSSILFLRKFTKVEYTSYQASISKINDLNEGLYTPRIKELEKEMKAVINKGCPAQMEVTEEYKPRFKTIIDNIDELLERLGQKPTKQIILLKEKFISNNSINTYGKLIDKKDIKVGKEKLKQYKYDLRLLTREYNIEFSEAKCKEWEAKVKIEYKDRIQKIKGEMIEKITGDIKRWIEENSNYPIFMASPEKIGYDATGRKCENQLPHIYEKFKEFIKSIKNGDPFPFV